MCLEALAGCLELEWVPAGISWVVPHWGCPGRMTGAGGGTGRVVLEVCHASTVLAGWLELEQAWIRGWGPRLYHTRMAVTGVSTGQRSQGALSWGHPSGTARAGTGEGLRGGDGPGAHYTEATLEGWLMLGQTQMGEPRVHGAGPTLGEVVDDGGQVSGVCWGGLGRPARVPRPCSHLCYQGEGKCKNGTLSCLQLWRKLQQ